MKTVGLTCSHCGAPLDVPENTKFITCSYCSSRLAVRQSGGALYTEVLEALDQRTERIAGDVEVLKLEGQLDRLDREWMMEREQYMVHGKHGRRRPTRTGTLIGLAVMVVMCLVFMFSVGHESGFVFGLLFLGTAVVIFVINLAKADQYERRLRHYERRRAQILSQIDSRRS